MSYQSEADSPQDIELYAAICADVRRMIPDLRDEFTASNDIATAMRRHIGELQAALDEAERSQGTMPLATIVSILEEKVSSTFLQMGEFLLSDAHKKF